MLQENKPFTCEKQVLAGTYDQLQHIAQELQEEIRSRNPQIRKKKEVLNALTKAYCACAESDLVTARHTIVPVLGYFKSAPNSHTFFSWHKHAQSLCRILFLQATHPDLPFLKENIACFNDLLNNTRWLKKTFPSHPEMITDIEQWKVDWQIAMQSDQMAKRKRERAFVLNNTDECIFC